MESGSEKDSEERGRGSEFGFTATHHDRHIVLMSEVPPLPTAVLAQAGMKKKIKNVNHLIILLYIEAMALPSLTHTFFNLNLSKTYYPLISSRAWMRSRRAFYMHAYSQPSLTMH